MCVGASCAWTEPGLCVHEARTLLIVVWIQLLVMGMFTCVLSKAYACVLSLYSHDCMRFPVQLKVTTQKSKSSVYDYRYSLLNTYAKL